MFTGFHPAQVLDQTETKHPRSRAGIARRAYLDRKIEERECEAAARRSEFWSGLRNVVRRF